MKRLGRKPTTGKFATRQELCDFIWMDWKSKLPGNSIAAIARRYRVSAGVANKIIDTREGQSNNG